MNPSRRLVKAVNAAALVERLGKDPSYIQRSSTRLIARQEAAQQHEDAISPIIDELKTAGFSVESLDELRRSGTAYETAIPVLLKWLPLVVDPSAKESVVRTLSVPWAKPVAAVPLIAEFKKQPGGMSSLKWAIGNALSIVADNNVADDLLALAQDKRQGKAREMIVVALSNLTEPRAVQTLLSLLDDNEVCGYAIIAIAQLKAFEAVSKIQRFINHPKRWIRNEAHKAIVELTR